MEPEERIQPAEAGEQEPLSWRGIVTPVLLAGLFLLLMRPAVRHSEIITGRRITSGVPPILVVAGLLLLLGAPPILRRPGLRRQWLHAERLSFPLLSLPLALAADGGRRYAGGKASLFHSPLLWIGFGVAAAFNALNIGRALIPTVPASGFYYSLAGMFTERPWTPFNSVSLYFMLETIGFGYLLPLDVSLSAWFLYLVEKPVAVGGILRPILSLLIAPEASESCHISFGG